jgi:hypothetical protein
MDTESGRSYKCEQSFPAPYSAGNLSSDYAKMSL